MKIIILGMAVLIFLLAGAIAIFQKTIQATTWLKPVMVCLAVGGALLALGMAFG